ncbi:preprotein translocase subunit SecB [Peptococcaceae bacterium]|nr:preprotein translocase subunit SecB [Peptococcaceae bacterium]
MDIKKIAAPFQFIGSRIARFSIETNNLKIKKNKATVNLDIDLDYDILELSEKNDTFFGVISYIVNIKALLQKSILFEIYLNMEGAFRANSNKIDKDQFKDMIELNGVAVLSHLSRSYILTITAMSGINPPIKLPMINIYKLKETKNKEKS